MAKKNKPSDVFKHIDMHGGDKSVCWEWLGGVTGIGRPSFSLGGGKITPYRLVYELIHGVKLERKEIICHQCDNPVCCNPDHLKLGTHQDNMNEMKERERHGLPHHTINAIRKLHSEGRQQTEIAELYGVHKSTIGRIVRNDAYQHVKETLNQDGD